MSVSSSSTGSTGSSWSRSVKSDGRSRKSSGSQWTNSSTRSKEHRLPDTPAVKTLVWFAGGNPSRVKKVKVYEDTYERDNDSWSGSSSGRSGRLEMKKEYSVVFVESSSSRGYDGSGYTRRSEWKDVSGRASRSSRRSGGDPWAKGRRTGDGGVIDDDDDDSDDDSTRDGGPTYGQYVPAPPNAGPGVHPGMHQGMHHPGMRPMGPAHPPQPPPNFQARPGMPPQQFRPPPGNMPIRGGGPPPPGFRPA
ncbi:hypothetical protein QBC33DRAFT_169447 [Phialemonium atrogriseum]|uniref:Uncharacterized protein n=1 Tax=Phialemonium atrogriseum TaxID=1093897 RepID=A0AAJ0C7Z4_9PEZI|nr:uncharacterized protein QBC33DRAFT_169447 [Phialemonium atrogriseum]KAK1771834.1 hypothetical protein QBC33DRAFT_169447 [Phialemonium atrogriseum]